MNKPMNNPRNKPVTQDRIKQLLECYGSAPAAWPEDERRAALNLLQGSPELKTLREQVRALDDLLTEYRESDNSALDSQRVQSLQQRMMDHLPDQVPAADNHGHGDSTSSRPHRLRFWMGGIAASALIASLALNVIDQTHSPDTRQTADIAGDEFTQWAWEEITGESLEAESENDPSTMVALLAMEFPTE